MQFSDSDRPRPTQELLNSDDIAFAAAPDLIGWARMTFVADDASLRNDDHRRLNQATIGALCTNLPTAGQLDRLSAKLSEDYYPAGLRAPMRATACHLKV